MKTMKTIKIRLLLLSLLLIPLALVLFRLPAAASLPLQEAYATPTALPDGRILYIVQPGDTCLRIALLTGLSVDYIRTTNQLNENCDLREGQQLLIGVGAPVQPSPTSRFTVEPTPTATPPVLGTAVICVLMYIDFNGDGLRQETEFGVDDGAVSVVSLSGPYSSQLTTSSSLDLDDQDGDFDTEEPLRACFYDLEPDTYTVSGGVPDGYNPTTFTDVAVTLAPGDTTYVDFGVQERVIEENGGGSRTNPLLGVIGAFLLLGGVGLGYYTYRILKK